MGQMNLPERLWNKMTLGKNIQAARRAKGISQEALAGQIGVSRQALGKWEKDTALPGLDNLQALAAALGVSVDGLLGLAQRETPAPAVTLDAMRALLEARDAEHARTRRLWAALAAAVAVFLLLAVWHLQSGTARRLREAESRLQTLNNNAENTTRRIEMLSEQVAALDGTLRGLNSTVAAWDWAVAGYDPAQGALTLAVTVTPRATAQGQTARLVAVYGGQSVAAPLQAADEGFHGELTLPLQAGALLELQVQWQQQDGTAETERLAGDLDLGGEPELGFRQAAGVDTAFRLGSDGLLRLNCYPVAVWLDLPAWMYWTEGGVSLWVDGAMVSRAPLDNPAYWAGDSAVAAAEDADAGNWSGGDYGATLPDEAYAYAGGEVWLQLDITDQFGNIWTCKKALNQE